MTWYACVTMLQALLKPRPLGAGAILAFVLGVGLVYAGFPAFGPMVMLAAILLSIFAAIAWTTPEDQVVAARRALAERVTAPASPRRRARVYDVPAETMKDE